MGDQHRFEFGKHLVGRTVNKKFKGFGHFAGKIVSFNSARGFYRVRYEDGDAEELDLEEVKGVLMARGRKRKRSDEETVREMSSDGKETEQETNPVGKKVRGRKKKKQESNPVESSESPTLALMVPADQPQKERKRRGRKKTKQERNPVESSPTLALMLPADLEKKTRGRKKTKHESNSVESSPPLALMLPADLQKKIRGRKKTKYESDPDESSPILASMLPADLQEKIREWKKTKNESNPVESSPPLALMVPADIQKKTRGRKKTKHESNPVECSPPLASMVPDDQPLKERKRRGRKKKKRGSNNPVESSPPLALTEPADQPRKQRKRRGRGLNAGPLRRSSRQAAVALVKCGEGNDKGAEEARVSGVGDRRPLDDKVPLPASSGDLLMPEESVPSLFYVYTTLRSFSKLLFLSPFRLQDFVGALNCEEANSLMDHVHLALLQTLRRHLEFIVPDEGPAAAAAIRCLRYFFLKHFSEFSDASLSNVVNCARETLLL